MASGRPEGCKCSLVKICLLAGCFVPSLAQHWKGFAPCASSSFTVRAESQDGVKHVVVIHLSLQYFTPATLFYTTQSPCFRFMADLVIVQLEGI